MKYDRWQQRNGPIIHDVTSDKYNKNIKYNRWQQRNGSIIHDVTSVKSEKV